MRGERSSTIGTWHALRCRVAATMRIFIRTIKPLLPKGLAAMFHTDLHWSRQAHQDHRAPKGPSRPLPWLRRDGEQSNEILALAARHATRSCGASSSRLFVRRYSFSSAFMSFSLLGV